MAYSTVLSSDLSTSKKHSRDLFDSFLIPNLLLIMARWLNWDHKARIVLGSVLGLLSARTDGELRVWNQELGRLMYPTKEGNAAGVRACRDLKLLRWHQEQSNARLVVITSGALVAVKGEQKREPTTYSMGQFPALFDRLDVRVIESELTDKSTGEYVPASDARWQILVPMIGEEVKAMGFRAIPDHVHAEAAAARKAKRAKGELIEGAFGMKATEADRIEGLHQDRDGAFNAWLDKLEADLGELQFIADTMDDMTKYRSIVTPMIESTMRGVEKKIRVKNKFGK